MKSNDACQSTIERSFALAGKGLHTGKNAAVRVLPGAPSTGVVFRRIGRGGRVDEAPAVWQRRVSRPLCTALDMGDDAPLWTIEHLMAALAAFGIDNAVVEVEGNELPILDGSAAPWCAALREAGTVRQAGGRSILRIIEPVEFVEGGRSIRIEPYEGYALRVEMDLAGFGTMIWDGDLTADRFEQELAPSRSFGRIKWALPLKIYQFVTGRDVLRGAHLGNVAAIWGSRVIGGMRLPGEPARHRALDLIGDLAMAGAPLQGRVSALRPGHEINHAFLRKLMETPQAWERVEL